MAVLMTGLSIRNQPGGPLAAPLPGTEFQVPKLSALHTLDAPVRLELPIRVPEPFTNLALQAAKSALAFTAYWYSSRPDTMARYASCWTTSLVTMGNCWNVFWTSTTVPRDKTRMIPSTSGMVCPPSPRRDLMRNS